MQLYPIVIPSRKTTTYSTKILCAGQLHIFSSQVHNKHDACYNYTNQTNSKPTIPGHNNPVHTSSTAADCAISNSFRTDEYRPGQVTQSTDTRPLVKWRKEPSKTIAQPRHNEALYSIRYDFAITPGPDFLADDCFPSAILSETA